MRYPVRLALSVAIAVSAQTASAQTLPAPAVVDGHSLFVRQCGTCHSLTPNEVRQGPSLAGVFNRKAGSLPDFKYSPGFAQADWVWDEAHLDPYLANPQAVIKGGVMGYRQSKSEIRTAIIAYLKENPS